MDTNFYEITDKPSCSSKPEKVSESCQRLMGDNTSGEDLVPGVPQQVRQRLLRGQQRVGADVSRIVAVQFTDEE